VHYGDEQYYINSTQQEAELNGSCLAWLSLYSLEDLERTGSTGKDYTSPRYFHR